MSVVISRALVLVLLGYGRRALAMIPTGPGPKDVFTAGQNCTIQWTTAAGPAWDGFDIDLMSGSNTNMTLVTNVTQGVDATNASASPFNWTCPEVEPYGKIYFYQFTSKSNSSDKQWTTRFTIQSPDGQSEPPAHVSQGYGQYGTVPWGQGHLANSSTSEPETVASVDSFSSSSVTTASGKTCRAHYMKSPDPEPSALSEPEPSASVTSFAVAPPEETATRCSGCEEDPAKRGAMLNSSAEELESEPWVRISIGFMAAALLMLAI
ncbi:hypothetical protein PENSPDRAFT_624991 [Peniophora sp. CONT]|nr:hypothetical protein PENSPDRAFT_624991 [Peniophora sp. CONT]